MEVEDENEFFTIVEPTLLETLLSASREVLETSLLIFAAFGLPRCMKLAYATEAAFVEAYGARFRTIVEGVSESVYKRSGVTESQMAVTIHKYVEELKDEQATSTIMALTNALQSLYNPPKYLELPRLIPAQDLASLAQDVVRKGALYKARVNVSHVYDERLNGGQRKQASVGGPVCTTAAFAETMYPGVFVILGFAAQTWAAGSAKVCSAAPGSMEGGGGDSWDKLKVVKAAEAMCEVRKESQFLPSQLLCTEAKARSPTSPIAEAKQKQVPLSSPPLLSTALQDNNINSEDNIETQECEDTELRQVHIQALVEAYSAKMRGGLIQGFAGGPEELDVISALELIDEIAAQPFEGDPLYKTIRQIEEERDDICEQEGVEDRVAKLLQAGRCQEAAAIHLSNGDPAEAARRYEQAFSLSYGIAPDTTLASILAKRAQALMQVQDDDSAQLSATSCANAALLLDECCAGAWALEGHRKWDAIKQKTAAKKLRKIEDIDESDSESISVLHAHEGDICKDDSVDDALGALVRCCVLDPGGTWESVEHQATTIEEVARERCASKVKTMFANSRKTSTLPPGWLSRSYFESFRGELDGTYYRRKLASATSICTSSLIVIQENDINNEKDSVFMREKGQKLREALTSFWSATDARRGGEHVTAMELFKTAFELASSVGSAESSTEDVTDGETAVAMLSLAASRVSAAALEQYSSYVYLTGDMKEAEEGFRHACVLDRTNSRPLIKLGSLLCDLDMKDEALEAFNEAEEMDEDDCDLLLHRGQFYMLTNEHRAAVRDLERACLCDDAPPVFHASLGVAIFKLGMSLEPTRLEQSLFVLAHAHERFPDSMEVSVFYSEVLTQFGDFAKALSVLAYASALDPTCPLPYVNAGRAYTAMGDLPTARKHLLKAAEVDPRCSGAHLDMGQVEMRSGNIKAAMEEYRQGIACSRYLSELHDAMACHDIAVAHLREREHFGRLLGRIPPTDAESPTAL